MLPTPCYVIGDAHLGVATPEAERALLDFLRALPARARSLVIMGDLFDFWFAWREAMPRRGFRVLAAIADLRDAGVEVLWIGGNHDCWGGDALMAETGVHYTLEPWRDQIGEWPVLLAHGDGLRLKEDAPYRRLRTVLRHPLSIRAFGWLHPDFATRVAVSSSDTSRHRRAGDEGRGLLAIATPSLESVDGPQLVIHGHSHVPTLQPVGRGWYANAGAWYLDRQFLRIDDRSITRAVWTGSGEGDVLNVGHRVVEKPSSEREESVRGV
ncbi:MAG: UDP-2,3-diacylglucosamine diphosphatase [Gemmatimonadaceae bacterium]|nr:UDP-2,3-diacylglucosamine diphosphatase [Gemmatimonadaceae bacterium]